MRAPVEASSIQSIFSNNSRKIPYTYCLNCSLFNAGKIFSGRWSRIIDMPSEEGSVKYAFRFFKNFLNQAG